MLLNMHTIDQLYINAREYAISDDLDNAGKCLEQVKERINNEIASSQRWYFIRNIENIYGAKKESFFLDYGCGGGQTVVYLHLMGFRNVYGIDIAPQDVNNKLLKLLGVREDCCLQYDGTTMAFEENKFDFVFSEQVLEHVHEIEAYYKEASRVMKSGAMAFFSFPHRMIPYDSHGRTWFIHMLPRQMAFFFYRILGRDVEYLDQIMNLQTISYHKKIATQYFCDFKNIASERIKNFSEDDLRRYKGNKTLRKVVDVMVKNKTFGPIALALLSNLAMVDLVMRKK